MTRSSTVCAWDWETYGEYLESVGRMPKGLNVGGMVGHCALRQYAMGERGLEQAPPTADDLAAMTDLLDEAMRGGALGFSTSRTFLHKVPDGRPVPGTYAEPDELYAFADVLGRHGAGVFETASRIGEGDRDDADIPGTRAEMAWMGEVSRRSGRPVSFGLLQHDSRPDLYARVIELAKHENATGGNVRPQTTARSVGILFSLDTRSPFDRAPCWRELRDMHNGEKLVALRDPVDPCPADRGGRRNSSERRSGATVRRQPTRRFDSSRRSVRPRSVDVARRHRRPARHQRRSRVHRVAARERRRAGVQLPVPQPEAVGSRAHARRARSSHSVWPMPGPTSVRSSTPASRPSCCRTGSASGSAGASRRASAG